MAKYDVNNFNVVIVTEPSGLQVVHATLDLQGTTGNKSQVNKKYRLCDDMNVPSIQLIVNILTTGLSGAIHNAKRIEISEFSARSYVTFIMDGNSTKFTGIRI